VPEHIRVGIDPDYSANRSVTLHELQHAIQQREGFARGGSPTTVASQFKDLVKKEYDAIRGADPSLSTIQAFDSASTSVYKRLAGEVEARDVQARMDFTPEQRKATAPYSSQGIAPEDMTINFLGGENKAITRWVPPGATVPKAAGAKPGAENFKTGKQLDAWLAENVDHPHQLADETRAGKLKDQGVGYLEVKAGRAAHQTGREASGRVDTNMARGADTSLVFRLKDGRMVWWDHETGDVRALSNNDPRFRPNPDYRTTSGHK
jgi:hypothetical protein